MDVQQVGIDELLVGRLVATQFPQWADLPVRPVANGGWDNRTFHLGDKMIVRLPSAQAYAAQVEREQRWLPVIAPMLPLSIPEPLAMGKPEPGYPWKWSIYRWIEGETADIKRISSLSGFASSLATFLVALQSADSTSGPASGSHNFYRGGPLSTYDPATRKAIAALAGKIDNDAACRVWEAAVAASWTGQPVWVHGDVSAGNLLVTGGELSAVIDFGQLSVGDPACDLAIAWTLFSGESRDSFRAILPLDAGTWARGRGWALWKALIVAAGVTQTNAVEGSRSWRTIEEVIADHGRTKA